MKTSKPKTPRVRKLKRPEGRAPIPTPALADAQLARLTRHWPGAVFYQRADFVIEQPDAKFAELTGAARQVQEPHGFWELVHEADFEALKSHCQKAALVPEGLTATFRFRHARTGQLFYAQEHRQAVLGPSGQLLGYHVLWLDITRQTLAEKRLVAAAKKAAFSGATAGFAHDFNNQMAGVLSLSDLLLNQIPPEDPKRPPLELIKRSAAQAAALLKRLVSLQRGKAGPRQYADLNQAVSETAELLKKVLSRRIEFQTEPAPQQVPVYLDAVEFGQVLLGLALNAAEAMPNGGALTVRVATHAEAPALEHFRGTAPHAPCASVCVQDTGQGISARHLPLCFEPFFTTKPPAKGAGVGLYQARQFAEQHGGAISVVSAEGAGTMLTLWLPQSDFTEAEKHAAEAAQRPPRLLLVGRAGATTEQLAQLLRAHHFDPVVTNAPERVAELLADPDNGLQGVFIAAAPEDAPLLDLGPAIQAQKLSPRVALQLLSGAAEAIDSALLTSANLVLDRTETPEAVVQKLKDLFPSS